MNTVIVALAVLWLQSGGVVTVSARVPDMASCQAHVAEAEQKLIGRKIHVGDPSDPDSGQDLMVIHDRVLCIEVPETYEAKAPGI